MLLLPLLDVHVLEAVKEERVAFPGEGKRNRSAFLTRDTPGPHDCERSAPGDNELRPCPYGVLAWTQIVAHVRSSKLHRLTESEEEESRGISSLQWTPGWRRKKHSPTILTYVVLQGKSNNNGSPQFSSVTPGCVCPTGCAPMPYRLAWHQRSVWAPQPWGDQTTMIDKTNAPVVVLSAKLKQ